MAVGHDIDRTYPDTDPAAVVEVVLKESGKVAGGIFEVVGKFTTVPVVCGTTAMGAVVVVTSGIVSVVVE